MAGKKGQIRRKATIKTERQRAWNSVRIYAKGGQAFGVGDLVITSGAKRPNLHRWIPQLVRHGILRAVGGRVVRGTHAKYRLSRDTGPVHPLVCDRCGKPLSALACAPAGGDP